MTRADHTFEFAAAEIAAAAKEEATYHQKRAEHWGQEYDKAVERVEQTIGAKIVRQHVTDGYTVSVVVDYGDRDAYDRMLQAFKKLQKHREDAERYRTDERVYGTQDGRVYELSVGDVHHFRLSGEKREG